MKTKRTIALILATTLILGLFITTGCSSTKGNKYANYPFPQHAQSEYAVAPMMPTNKTQEELDQMTIDFFKKILLTNFIVDANTPANKDEFRMVINHQSDWLVEDGEFEVSDINVSESQGYGMMMLAYMAGCEDELGLTDDQWIYGCSSLHEYYDAMLRTVLEFPSVIGAPNNHLLSWQLFGYPKVGKNTTGYKVVGGVKTAPFVNPKDGDSATDGDMDIIYSLMLADKQWGSDGKYNYKQIATDMLGSLWDYCVHKLNYNLTLGDWSYEIIGDELGDATRPSDFIVDHLKAYCEFDKTHNWQAVVDATYGVIKDIRDSEKKKGFDNGLLPDFVLRGEEGWEIPDAFVIEDDIDYAYNYNSCRIPWRLGTDYLLYGNSDIGDSTLYDYSIKPLDDFARSYKDGDLDKFGPIFLDGTCKDKSGNPNGYNPDWYDPDCFAPEFLVTAVATKADQEWVNKIWAWKGLTKFNEDTYSDYIKLFVMLTASGNYWKPAIKK